MLQIAGRITLTSHARQTAPDGTQGGKSQTIKTRVLDGSGVRREIPYITGNSLRGLLRRAAATIVLDQLIETQGKVPRQLFQVLTRGAHTRDGIGQQATVEQMQASGRHVFAGLFGGGPTMIHSRYSIGYLLPQVEWCSHMLHPSLVDSAIKAEQLSYRDEEGNTYDKPLTTWLVMAPRDDLLAGKGEEYIEDYQTSLEAWLDEVGVARSARKEAKKAVAAADKSAKKSAAAVVPKSKDLSNFTLNECMLPGTPLQFLMRFKPATTPAQVGLMLMAIRDWANANVVGGNSSQGFGRFNAALSLFDGEARIVENLFNPNDHATTYSLSPDVEAYVTAATKELKSLTVAQLNAVYPWQQLDAGKAAA